MNKNLHFTYFGLEDRLRKFKNHNVQNLDVSLIVSLEKDYYMGENMKLIMKDLKGLFKNKKIIIDIDGETNEFKINYLNLQLGDTLNWHTFYYRYCIDYFEKHNIDKEELIPENIRKQFKENAHIAGINEGKQWFIDNLEAIQLFSDEKQLTKDFNLTDGITTIFEETDYTPKLQLTCYSYWYKHSRYYEIEKSLKELCSMENSLIDDCYKFEAERFFIRLSKRNETPKFKDLFLKQSYKYLFDETMPSVIENSSNNPNNYMDLYFGGLTPAHITIYDGKRAKKNPIIQQYLKTSLKGLNDAEWVTIK